MFTVIAWGDYVSFMIHNRYTIVYKPSYTIVYKIVYNKNTCYFIKIAL